MHFFHAEVLQQVVEHARLGHKVGGTHQRLPLEGIVAVTDVGQQVLGIQDALNVVRSLLIDRHARITRVDHLAHDLVERVFLVNVHHVNAGTHDIAHRLVTERENALEQFLLVRVIHLTDFQSARQVIDRQFFGLTRHYLVNQACTAHQQCRQRREQLDGSLERRRCHGSELDIEVGGIQFRDDFTEEQNQEGQDHRLHNKVERCAVEIKNLIHRVVQHDGNHDVDQVVSHQNGGQQFLGHGEQFLHALTPIIILDVVHIVVTQREISNLTAGVECRQKQT